MTFISYAQNFEDVMLWRALKHIENGFYIDVGAWSPDLDSVTRAFYERGWHGINLEPNAEFYAQLQAQRSRDINLPLAVGYKEGKQIINILSNPGLSTLDESIAQRHSSSGLTINKQDIDVINLSGLWEQNVPEGQDVHFLKVDVEGLEEAVLQGNDWTKNRPWIVVVEATLPMSQQETHESWEPILLNANYYFAYADGLNRFYVASEHIELLSAFKYPPNVFDDFKPSAQHQAETRFEKAISESSTAMVVEREHAKWLENEWNAEKNRVEELIGEISLVRDKYSRTEGQLTERSLALESANQALNQELEKSKWLENEWNAAKNRVEELIGEISLVRDKYTQIEDQLTERSQALDSTNQALIQEREHSKWLENEWNAEKIKNDELIDKSNQWWIMADGLSNELQGMRSSFSWRITSPLRDSFDLLLWKKNKIKRILIAVKNGFCSLLGIPIAYTIRFFLAHPLLKDKALFLVRSFPSLEKRLREFARSRGLITDFTLAPTYSENSWEMPSDLTSNARQIYDEIKSAIERRNKGGY